MEGPGRLPGAKKLFDKERCFFYITNDEESAVEEIVFDANDRCSQENLLAQLKGGVRAPDRPGGQPAAELGLHGAGVVGLEPEGLAGAAVAGVGPLAATAPRGETGASADGIQHVPRGDDPHSGADRFHGPEIVCRLLAWNPWQHVFFRLLDQLAQPLRC